MTSARTVETQQLLLDQQKGAMAPVRGQCNCNSARLESWDQRAERDRRWLQILPSLIPARSLPLCCALRCCCAVGCADLLRSLGVESVLVWVGVLCKKRVLVYGGDVDAVQDAVRSAGLLGAWHRQSFDFLRPLCLLRDEEVADLKAAGVYVAGTVDPQASLRRDLYDIAIDRQLPVHSLTAPLTGCGDRTLQGSSADGVQHLIRVVWCTLCVSVYAWLLGAVSASSVHINDSARGPTASPLRPFFPLSEHRTPAAIVSLTLQFRSGCCGVL